MKIEIGMPYSFRPAAFMAAKDDGAWQTPVLHGKVIYINREHGFFTVEATVNGRTLRESFRGVLATRLANRARPRNGYRH